MLISFRDARGAVLYEKAVSATRAQVLMRRLREGGTSVASADERLDALEGRVARLERLL